uniref:L1 transposable element RRM domain-containing protein n=1 Tax=Myripristis murdjan TaxID=586833 RepID=A0A667XYD2_9TELE
MANLRRKKQNKLSTFAETSPVSLQANPTSMADQQMAHDSLLKAIQESKEDLLKHMDKKTADIQTSLSKIETSLSTLSEQVQELETRVGANEDNINEYCSRTEKLEKQVSFLKEKVDDLENRSRRSNVRIINIPEKMEGRDTTGFLEQLIPKLLGHDNFSSPIVVERAHRIGKVSDRPRPIIAKFLNFTHKEKVLRLAWEKVHQNSSMLTYPLFLSWYVHNGFDLWGFVDVHPLYTVLSLFALMMKTPETVITYFISLTKFHKYIICSVSAKMYFMEC